MFRYMRMFEEEVHRSIHYLRHWSCVLYKPFVEELVCSHFKDVYLLCLESAQWITFLLCVCGNIVAFTQFCIAVNMYWWFIGRLGPSEDPQSRFWLSDVRTRVWTGAFRYYSVSRRRSNSGIVICFNLFTVQTLLFLKKIK